MPSTLLEDIIETSKQLTTRIDTSTYLLTKCLQELYLAYDQSEKDIKDSCENAIHTLSSRIQNICLKRYQHPTKSLSPFQYYEYTMLEVLALRNCIASDQRTENEWNDLAVCLHACADFFKQPTHVQTLVRSKDRPRLLSNMEATMQTIAKQVNDQTSHALSSSIHQLCCDAIKAFADFKSILDTTCIPPQPKCHVSHTDKPQSDIRKQARSTGSRSGSRPGGSRNGARPNQSQRHAVSSALSTHDRITKQRHTNANPYSFASSSAADALRHCSRFSRLLFLEEEIQRLCIPASQPATHPNTLACSPRDIEIIHDDCNNQWATLFPKQPTTASSVSGDNLDQLEKLYAKRCSIYDLKRNIHDHWALLLTANIISNSYTREIDLKSNTPWEKYYRRIAYTYWAISHARACLDMDAAITNDYPGHVTESNIVKETLSKRIRRYIKEYDVALQAIPDSTNNTVSAGSTSLNR